MCVTWKLRAHPGNSPSVFIPSISREFHRKSQTGQKRKMGEGIGVSLKDQAIYPSNLLLYL